MTKYLSNKIRAISFISILLVIQLHSQMIVQSSGFNLWIQRFITEEITRVAVPFFFLISGFLFFYKLDKLNLHWYCRKMKSRCKSLLIPYILWSVYGFLMVYMTKLYLPSAFTSVKPLCQISKQDFIVALFWTPVGTYQLWFVRDLFLCVVISPLLYLGIKKLRELFLVFLLAFWLRNYHFVISMDSILFVTLGAYISLNFKSIVEMKFNCKYSTIIWGIVWLALCFLNLTMLKETVIHAMALFTGIIFIWMLYDLLYIKKNNFFLKLSVSMFEYTFFLYAFHEPILTFIKAVLIKSVHSQFGMFFVYFMAPILTIILSFFVAKIFKKYFTNIYFIFTGGR